MSNIETQAHRSKGTLSTCVVSTSKAAPARRNHRWTAEEDHKLRTLAPLGNVQLLRAFPHLTRDQIRGRAYRLGIKVKAFPDSSRQWLRGRLPNPKHAHPLVREVVREANRQGWFLHELAEKAGVGRQTISKWRYSVTPHFVGFLAVVNALGLDVKLVRREEESSAACE